jgi:hypothetical protein
MAAAAKQHIVLMEQFLAGIRKQKMRGLILVQRQGENHLPRNYSKNDFFILAISVTPGCSNTSAKSHLEL